jgi:hypothetical protein
VSRRIDVRIDQLVLDGVDAAEAKPFAAEVEREIARLLLAPRRQAAVESPPAQVGATVARSIREVLP